MFIAAAAPESLSGSIYAHSVFSGCAQRRFRIGRAFEESLAWSKILRLPISWVLWRALRAALPPAFAPAAIHSLQDGSYVRRSAETSFVASFSEPENLFSNAWMQAPPEPLQTLDCTHPFAHRPLGEFLMTVPTGVLCRPGEPRRLMRHALSDLWPPGVRKRRSKGVFNAPGLEALRPLARGLLKGGNWKSLNGFCRPRQRAFSPGAPFDWARLQRASVAPYHHARIVAAEPIAEPGVHHRSGVARRRLAPDVSGIRATLGSVPGFTPQHRGQVKADLLDLAARDPRLSGAAVTGSAVAGNEDQWSDIDLAFGVTDPALVRAVMADFSDFLYASRGVLHHHDIRFGPWTYRVFFLPGALQVDLAFVEKSEFGPLGPKFKLVSGEANPLREFPVPTPKDLIGFAWLYALHARTCILRGKLWQAEYMISAVRDHALALACVRHNVPSTHGSGMDLLPESVTGPLGPSLVRKLEPDELWRTLDVVIQSLSVEIGLVDPALGSRTLEEIANLATKPPT